jgi:UDP-N-acetylglucosamine 3-dehydrogenase
VVKIGVVGAGGWGKNHLRVLSELEALAAFCDVDPEKLDFYAKKYRTHAYPRLDDMLENEALDGVTICTPTTTHGAVAAKTLERGLDTFVEKPLTYTSREGERLVRLAAAQGVVLAVGYIERFNPAVTELARILEGGGLGQPLLLEFHRENRWPATIRDVGVVLDTSVHDIDTARWLFKEEPESVFARVGKVIGNHEDFAAITLAFGGQRTAFIASNWVTPKRVRQLTAVCTNGVGTVDFITQELRLDDAEGTRIPRIERKEPLMLELMNFLDAAEERGPPLTEGRDAVMTTRISELALESGRIGQKVTVPPR